MNEWKKDVFEREQEANEQPPVQKPDVPPPCLVAAAPCHMTGNETRRCRRPWKCSIALPMFLSRHEILEF